MLDERFGRVSVVAYDRRYSWRWASVPRAIMGSSDESVESEGTYGARARYAIEERCPSARHASSNILFVWEDRCFVQSHHCYQQCCGADVQRASPFGIHPRAEV